jgi:hypothetical protein
MLVDGGDEEGGIEGEMDGGRDLDDDVPEGDEAMGWDDTEDEEDQQQEEDDDDDGSSTSEAYDNARLRAEETLRQAMTRGNADLAETFDGYEEGLDEDGRGAMLDEDDFVPVGHMGLDMDANLDDDIPDADASGLGGYEHTDSDDDLTTSEEAEDDDDDDDDHHGAYANVSRLAPPQSPTIRAARERGREEPRTSMDLSSILSRDESSLMGSSSPGMRGAQARRP